VRFAQHLLRYIKTLDFLIESNIASFVERDKRGVMQAAIVEGRDRMVEHLFVKYGINDIVFDGGNNKSASLGHYAAAANSVETLKALAQHGVSMNRLDTFRFTLRVARAGGI
jgi:hypothetical protein